MGDADPLVEQRHGAVADAEKKELERRMEEGREVQLTIMCSFTIRKYGKQAGRKGERKGGREGRKSGKQRTLTRYSLGILVMLKASASQGTYSRQKTEQRGNERGKEVRDMTKGDELFGV